MAERGACDLCGLPLLGRPLTEGDHRFCCEGCRRVFDVAEQSGLSDVLASVKSGERRRHSARKADIAAAAGARRETFRLTGMWCASCSLLLEEALLAVDGVLDAEVSYAASLTRVTWDPERADRDDIARRVNLLGYELAPMRDPGPPPDAEMWFLRFFVSAVIGMWLFWPAVFMLWPAFAEGDFAGVVRVEAFEAALSLVALVFGGWPFLVGAFRAARVGRATMDTLVALGTWTAWGYSVWAAATASGATYFDSAAMITAVVALGRWLEARGTRDVLAGLERLPEPAAEAWRVSGASPGGRDAEPERVPTSELSAGEVVVVRAGERVPADGVLASGAGSVDAAQLTGEARLVELGAGEEVFAGAILLDGELVVRVTRVGPDTLWGRLAALAEDAAFARSSAERLADRVAAAFVPLVLAIAAVATLAALGYGLDVAVERGVSVLVVACPCALALAMPLASANAVAAARGLGVTIRGSEALDRARALATVLFDKTGTLTEGRLELEEVVPATAAAAALRLAAAAEGDAGHPIASALRAAAAAAAMAEAPPASESERLPGLGVRAVVDGAEVLVGSDALLRSAGIAIPEDSAERAAQARENGAVAMWLARDGEVVALFVLADRLRPEAAASVAALAALGIESAIASGDAAATCEKLAERVGIEMVWAECSPTDKERIARELGTRGAVAVVGDGVNDAAALSIADFAIAVPVVGGSEVAAALADAVLPLSGPPGSPGPLAAIPPLVELGRRTGAIARQNVVWAFGYNLVMVPLAAAGALSPLVAAVCMALSSLAVVANSTRLSVPARRPRSSPVPPIVAPPEPVSSGS